MLSEDELLNLKRRCLESLVNVAPLECDPDAILRAAQLAFENLLEGMPGTEPIVRRCTYCGDTDLDISSSRDDNLVCNGCGEEFMR